MRHQEPSASSKNYVTSQSFFFEMSGGTPYCKCNDLAAVRQVKKSGKNEGKWFYCCRKTEEEGKCNFFVWRDNKKRELEVEEPPVPVQAKPVARTISDAQLVGIPRPQQDVFEPRSPKRSHLKGKKLLNAAPAWLKRHRDELREIAEACTAAADALDAQIPVSEEEDSE